MVQRAHFHPMAWALTAALGAISPGSTVSFGANAARAIEVLGHRGARASRPENTLPAFSYAIDQGVDTIELDVQVSKDGQLIVAHDLQVPTGLCQRRDGTTLAEGIRFQDMTLLAIKELDCGSKKHPDFPEQQPVPQTSIPTLAEVFALVNSTPNAKHVRLQIEAKMVPRYANKLHAPDVMSQAIRDLAQNYGLLDRIVIQSFDHRVVVAAKKMSQSIKTAALLAPNFPDWPTVIRAAQADILSPHLDWVTKEAVAAAHNIGTRVVPYTANTQADWEYLLGCGVDGIITDDPKSLLAFLRSKRLR